MNSARRIIWFTCFILFFTAWTECKQYEVEFVYIPKTQEKINTISVAGSFNSWNPAKDFLKKQPDGSYKLKLLLNEGFYQYKFVINGNKWIEDPRADQSLRRPDGYGGFNSGIIVGETAEAYGTAVAGDIVISAVKHLPDDVKYFNVVSKDIIEVILRTLKDDIEMATFVCKDEFHKMKKVKSALGFDYWKVTVFLKDINMEKIEYYFLLKDIDKEVRYPEKVFVADLKPKFYTPDWAKSAGWYQIMLDRFYDGDPANNPQNSLPWTWDFNKQHPSEKGKFFDFVWDRYFGGDFQGLTKKLDYLQELGVNAIYLTPVFYATSYHKYNTADYRHIDPYLGYKEDIYEIQSDTAEDMKKWKWTKTDKLFLEFIDQAHQRGMKVIIDGVFNHSGEDFWAFKDLKQKGKKSKYKDWYIITDWKIFETQAHLGKGYVGWAGFGGLPEYAEDDNGLVKGIKDHIFAITKRWMDPNGDGDPSDGIDGWRLDVPECVKMPFWEEWCKLVKSINPEAYIVGEIWDEAPLWLNEKLFHAQMNYPLAKRIVKFVIDKNLTPSQFDKQLKELFDIYPLQVNFVQMNLLDSHDTDRLASMCYNPGRAYDKRNRLNPADTGDYNPNYKNTKPPQEIYNRMKLAVVLQFTLPGAPCIWYGDEVGIWGADDPFNRKPMLWKELEPYDEPGNTVMDELFEYYKKIILVRKKLPELQTGIFETLLSDDEGNVYAFFRRKGDRVTVVVINNDLAKKRSIQLSFDKEVLPPSSILVDVLSKEEKKFKVDKNGRIKIVIPKETAVILSKQ
ncbi:MAG: alpha amylase N-terminal ig-like domain-containing protein [Endomicrobia bacterium]|nr:alpha amylase N-terminal ig-like domain-containing protein [Endomicrobiia bacterium]